MENKFYVGIVHHGKKFFTDRKFFRDEYNEKIVLYKVNEFLYLDLLSGICYSTNINNREYILDESLVETNIDDYKVDYRYLLSRYEESTLTRKKKKDI